MVIGGRTDSGRTDDIEIVSPDPVATPLPSCLNAMNPFPFGAMHNGRGAAIAPGRYILQKHTMSMSVISFHFQIC